jgi:hypothetical protein
MGCRRGVVIAGNVDVGYNLAKDKKRQARRTSRLICRISPRLYSAAAERVKCEIVILTKAILPDSVAMVAPEAPRWWAQMKPETRGFPMNTGTSKTEAISHPLSADHTTMAHSRR